MSARTASIAAVAITGGARGIGLATAKAFAARGARVMIGDLDADLAARAAAELSTPSGSLPLDVADRDSFATFLDGAEAAVGPLDVLVNNAGVMLTGEFLSEEESTMDKMVTVNLTGPLTGSRLAGQRFAERGRGHIVNIASMAGVAGFPGVVSYCATKFGTVGLTTALREELWPTGVRVSAVLPGIVHTELSAGVKISPLVERFGSCEPEDIAATVLRTVDRNKALAYTPGRLAMMLRATAALPEPARRALAKALGVDRLYLNVDHSIRDLYHSRATK